MTATTNRVLPPSHDDAAWTPQVVDEIADYWKRTVCPAAHALAHPRPIHGCPGCPPAEGEVPDRSSETHWREVADRRPGWVAA